MFVATLVHLLMAVQGCFRDGGFAPVQFVPFGAVLIMGWGLYIFSMRILHRVSFEIETGPTCFSGIGINLLAANDIDQVKTQLAAMLIGIVLSLFSHLVYERYGPGGKVPPVYRHWGPPAVCGEPA